MDQARIVALIETDILRRGEGVADDPIRIVRQWFRVDGTLVMEQDPQDADKLQRCLPEGYVLKECGYRDFRVYGPDGMYYGSHHTPEVAIRTLLESWVLQVNGLKAKTK